MNRLPDFLVDGAFAGFVVLEVWVVFAGVFPFGAVDVRLVVVGAFEGFTGDVTAAFAGAEGIKIGQKISRSNANEINGCPTCVNKT